jgi:hypothetical protein
MQMSKEGCSSPSSASFVEYAKETQRMLSAGEVIGQFQSCGYKN